MHQLTYSSSNDFDDSDDGKIVCRGKLNNKENSKIKRRRKRTTWNQRLILEKAFQANQYPDTNIRSELAEQVGMSSRKVSDPFYIS
jgi:hypothetical protein